MYAQATPSVRKQFWERERVEAEYREIAKQLITKERTKLDDTDCSNLCKEMETVEAAYEQNRTIEDYRNEFEELKQQIQFESKRAAKLEQNIRVLTAGYQKR